MSAHPGIEWRDMQVSELVHRVVPSPNCNDRVLPVGASYWVRLAEAYLAPAA